MEVQTPRLGYHVSKFVSICTLLDDGGYQEHVFFLQIHRWSNSKQPILGKNQNYVFSTRYRR